MLERAGVPDEQPQYASTIQPSAGRTQNAIAMAAAADYGCRAQRRRRRKLAGGNWPVLLERVQPVGLAVADVVDQIDDARDARKKSKRPPVRVPRRPDPTSGAQR